jgi:hypothetical protein
MVKGTFWKIFKKSHLISRKKVMKSPRFLENLGRFSVFFFWNWCIRLIASNGWPTCNRITRFLTFVICLVAIFV